MDAYLARPIARVGTEAIRHEADARRDIVAERLGGHAEILRWRDRLAEAPDRGDPHHVQDRRWQRAHQRQRVIEGDLRALAEVEPYDETVSFSGIGGRHGSASRHRAPPERLSRRPLGGAASSRVSPGRFGALSATTAIGSRSRATTNSVTSFVR